MRDCARFFVEIASELYFFRLKMVKRKEISVEGRAQIIILQKIGKNYWEIAKILKISLCASGAETRFSVTAESNGMLWFPLQRNIM